MGTTTTAKWDKSQDMYLCDICGGIWSVDGCIWFDDYGGHVTGPEFDSAEIQLIGGPCDGEIVR